MATDNAVIVIAQAETGHVEVAPAGDGHTGEHTTETLGASNLEHAESGMPHWQDRLSPVEIKMLTLYVLALGGDRQ